MEQAYETDPDVENKLCSLLISRVQDYAIFMLSPDGKVMTWNDGARLIKGYNRSEIVGQPMSRFYTSEDQQRGRPAELLHQAESIGRVEDEGWRVRKDGTRFWADVVVTALRDDTGKAQADCRVNGADWEPGARALRKYARAWPKAARSTSSPARGASPP